MCFHRMLFVTILLLVCTVELGYCVTVEFFAEPNYKGLLAKKSVDGDNEKKCISLDNYYRIQSIRTDKCVMVYEGDNCVDLTNDYSQAIRIPVGVFSYRVSNSTARFYGGKAYESDWKVNHDRGASSFHVCSQERGGGPKLDIDLFGPKHSGAYNPSSLLKSWKGVCKCENVPISIVKEMDTPFIPILSINNHGNSLYTYTEENCGGRRSIRIPGGDNYITRLVWKGNGVPLPIRSFRPADHSGCLM